jgi:cell division control protein 24
MGTQKDKKDKKDKNKTKEPNKNAKLQLKGRIFMTNVTEVLSLAKQGNSANSLLGSLFNHLLKIV